MRSNRSHFSNKDGTMRERLVMKIMNNTSHIAIMGVNVCQIESLDYE